MQIYPYYADKSSICQKEYAIKGFKYHTCSNLSSLSIHESGREAQMRMTTRVNRPVPCLCHSARSTLSGMTSVTLACSNNHAPDFGRHGASTYSLDDISDNRLAARSQANSSSRCDPAPDARTVNSHIYTHNLRAD